MNKLDLQKMMRTGEGIDALEKNLLGLDSEFRFKCRKCGKCCKNQDTILLNTRDIFRIAQKQGKTMQGVIRDYTEAYVGKNSRVPVVHLLSNGHNRTCPLLVDGRCSVHDCKPAVCALFPLGRVIVNPKQGEKIGYGDVKYILNDHSCGSAKRVNTVRSWLEKFGIPEQDEFFLLWNTLVMDFMMLVRQLEADGCPRKELVSLWNKSFQMMYIQFDTSQEFMPQFRRAVHQLKALFESSKNWRRVE